MMIHRGLTFSLVVLSASGCGSSGRPSATLLISAPSRLTRGLTSTDDTLCSRLDVDVTFGLSEDLGSPAFDRAPLVPKNGAPCTWVLEDTKELRAGTYDLVVRFHTKTPPRTCGSTMLVGAYVKRSLSFPFEEGFQGLTDEDFVSRAGEEAMLDEAGVDFDADHDGRDTLAEFGQGADPCKASSRPVIDLSVSSTAAAEGSVVRLNVRTEDADDVRHAVNVSITQPRGPSAGTETIRFRAFTDGDLAPSITPIDAQRPTTEHWALIAGNDEDPRPGAGSWSLDLTLDEPFLDSLAVVAFVDDGQGTTLAEAVSKNIVAEDRDDATRLLFEEGVSEVERSELRFAEGQETVHRFRFQDDDRDADVTAWTASLSSGPAGLALTRDGGSWTLVWTPLNADVVSPPPSGHRAMLSFTDVAGTVQGTAEILLTISPLRNDAPSFTTPTLGEQALPSVAFASHTLRFVVTDPDRVDQTPTCAAIVEALAPTTCPAPFSRVRCEPTGPRAGENWPFAIVLEPATDYFSSCGSSPSFLVRYSVTDVPPIDSQNGAESASTTTACAPGSTGCSEHLRLRTANVVAGTPITTGPAFIPNFANATPVLIDGAGARALVSVEDPLDSYNEHVVLLDLTFPTPTMAYRFPKADLCHVLDLRPRLLGVVDETNCRALVYGRALSGSYCSGDSGAWMVSLSTRVTTFRTSQTICGSQFNGALQNPVVDGAGNIYVPCLVDPGKIVRIAPDGSMTSKSIALYDYRSFNLDGQNALFEDPGTGSKWLVWPDNTGIVLIDLRATFDTATPVAQKITMGPTWWQDRIEDHVIDSVRKSYVFAHSKLAGGADLYRINFTQSSPALEGPLPLGDIGGSFSNGTTYMRLALRDSLGEAATPDVDLVVSPGSSGAPRPHVDLDNFSVVIDRPSVDYYLGYSAGIFPSPDRRFYVAPTLASTEDAAKRGVYLYRWDPSAPRQFIDLPVPTGGGDDAADTVISKSGDLMVISESSAISVLYFVDAALGLD